jgi:putative transcriptional regulator
MTTSPPLPGFTKARLLVAVPELVDPNFVRAVVLMLEHTDDGALGVILNRPRLVGGAEAVPHWADRLAYPARLHDGGPVSTDSVIGLGRGPVGSFEGLSPLVGRVGVVDLHRDPAELPEIDEVRLFAGYAGWSAGQLEAELAAGGWLVADAHEEDARSGDPDGLWRNVMGRQDGMAALLRDYPDDASLN